jgi:hypothetical protein
MNSLVIVLFLSGMVAMITVRSLHKDIARYNSLESQEEAQEEFGWKLVHGRKSLKVLYDSNSQAMFSDHQLCQCCFLFSAAPVPR